MGRHRLQQRQPQRTNPQRVTKRQPSLQTFILQYKLRVQRLNIRFKRPKAFVIILPSKTRYPQSIRSEAYSPQATRAASMNQTPTWNP